MSLERRNNISTAIPANYRVAASIGAQRTFRARTVDRKGFCRDLQSQDTARIVFLDRTEPSRSVSSVELGDLPQAIVQICVALDADTLVVLEDLFRRHGGNADCASVQLSLGSDLHHIASLDILHATAR